MGIEERFWSKVLKRGPYDCWLWIGRRSDDRGYGRFDFGRRIRPAHAIAFELTTGRSIPIGMELDHLCRNRACVNPLHLEPVSHLENIRRAHPLSTHCKRGHLLTPDVLYVSPTGKKKCRDCRAIKRSGQVRRTKRAVARGM